MAILIPEEFADFEAWHDKAREGKNQSIWMHPAALIVAMEAWKHLKGQSSNKSLEEK